MRIIHFVLFLIIALNSYSQKLKCDSIVGKSYNEVYYAISDTIYSINESRCFGEILAKYDISNGKKIILRNDGPFSNGCFDCIYCKYGYSTVSIGSDDIIWDNFSAFIDSYNNEMISLLSLKEKDEISVLFKQRKHRNVLQKYGDMYPKISATEISDSVFNIKFSLPNVDSLFNSNTKNIIVGIQNINDSIEMKYSYDNIKTEGINVKINTSLKNMLLIYLYFHDVPEIFDICWCKCLEQKYSFGIKLQ